MSPQAQVPARSCLHAVTAIFLVAMLAGCAGKINATSLGIDDSIRTGSVTAANAGDDSDESLDAITIRNAVTSADLPALNGRALAWANPQTGSTGNVSRIDEFLEQGALCRRFVASRQKYDGVALYRGEACLRDRGDWQLRQFETENG